METDLSVSAAEADALLSEVYGPFVYGTVASTGLRYFETSTTFTTAGLSYISEPTDQLALVDTVERVLNTAGRLRRLRRMMPQERARWSGKTGHARRWELVDDQINLYPTPPAGDQYVLRYIPQAPDLSTYGDTDLVDVVTPEGLSALIWGTSVLLLAKSKSDVTLAMGERDRAVGRLSEWASDRCANDPQRMISEEDCDDDAPWADGEWWFDR